MNSRDLNQLVLGETETPIAVTTSEENRNVALAMIRQTRQSLIMLSRDLDSRVYDHAELVEAVKDFVLASRHASVQIIVQDSSHVVQQGHRLVDLCRRLPSYMTIRVPAKEHETYNSAFMVSDRVGVLHRIHADRYDGSANFNDRQMGDDLTKMFGEMWEVAKPPSRSQKPLDLSP